MTDVKLIVVDDSKSISEKANEMAKEEYIIILRNEENVSVTEGYFCIRNALAHGDFDVEGQFYLLHNETKKGIKGMARVKESSLLKWIDLIDMKIEEIKMAGKK